MFKGMARVFILSLIIVAAFTSQSALAQKVDVNLITAPFGTSSYVLGTALEEIIRKNDGSIAIAHTETPGVNYNIKKLEKNPEEKKNTIFTSGASVVAMARLGLEPYTEPTGDGILTVAYYNVLGVWFVTRDNSIKTVGELKGKKVGIGTKQQAGWSLFPAMMLTDGAGIKKNEINLQWIGANEAVAAFKDRLIDACIAGGYFNPRTEAFVPAPFFQELLATVDHLNFVDFSEAVIKNTTDITGIPFAPYTVNPGKVQQLEQPIVIGLSPVGWYAYKDFPEDTIYKITKQIIMNVDKFGEYHGLGKLMSKEMLCWGLTPKELHPGAYRAYKEFGLMN